MWTLWWLTEKSDQEGVVCKKTIYMGEVPKKGGFRQFADLRGQGLTEKKGWCF